MILLILFSLIAYKNMCMQKASNYKTSILVLHLDIEKIKFQAVVFWLTYHLPSQLLYFEMNVFETMITSSAA